MLAREQIDDWTITLGVEEEFFLVDPESHDLLIAPDPGIFEFCNRICGPNKITREVLRSQIETGTRVCNSISELQRVLRETRQIVVQGADRHGAAVFAASMHPFARWQAHETTAKARYEEFEQTYQDTIRRYLIGGMHIHAGFADADTRVQVMTAMRQYLPLFHALSTSSPFADGRVTGFKSWRLTLQGALPRTGLPPAIRSYSAHQQMIAEYKRYKFIRDDSELWWDMRPSHSYPTVELRICDVCTKIEDAISIAALYICLIRFLVRRLRNNRSPDEPLAEIIEENRWIAHRYGVVSFFGGLDGCRMDIHDCLTSLLEDLTEDARALDCEAELLHTLTIIKNGTSADRQLDLYRLCRTDGDSHEKALRNVVEMILKDMREEILV